MIEVKIKTDETLLRRLESAAKRKRTAEEIEKQRISFIYSGMRKDSGMSKADIEKALKKVS
ncbi:MAG: hypothetical protein MK186_01540 [Henriciella sp.]|nr:hypothetical protein [Henriciella sp.]